MGEKGRAEKEAGRASAFLRANERHDQAESQGHGKTTLFGEPKHNHTKRRTTREQRMWREKGSHARRKQDPE